MYRTERQQIVDLLEDGWQYSTRAVEPRGDQHLPQLIFRKGGRDKPMNSTRLYHSERAAWAWCDQWAEAALHLTDEVAQ